MTVNAPYNRELCLPSPSLSTSSSFASSSSSSSSSFVFKSKRYTQKPDPMSWISRKPILSQELLLEHANGAVDLGPFAETVPGFTPLTFLKPGQPLSHTTYVHPRQPEGSSALPTGFQFPSPSIIKPLRPPPSQATTLAKPSTTAASSSSNSISVSFTSTSTSTPTPTRPSCSRHSSHSSHSLSLSELMQDESAESDELEARAMQTKNAFPQTGLERRRRKKQKKWGQECPPKSDTQETPKSTQDSDGDENLDVVLTPPKIVFSKNSEKTRNALSTTHDCHSKLTTT